MKAIQHFTRRPELCRETSVETGTVDTTSAHRRNGCVATRYLLIVVKLALKTRQRAALWSMKPLSE